MGEGPLHASSPLWQRADDVPRGEIECEALEAGAVLEDVHLPGTEGCAYPDMVEPLLVEEVGEEWGEDLGCADKAAEVCRGAECVCELAQEGGADEVRGGREYGCCVYGDVLYVHGEVVVGGEGGKGGHLVLGALCMARGVFDAGVQRGNCTREKGAADERGGDEVRAVELCKDELEHIQIHVHGQVQKRTFSPWRLISVTCQVTHGPAFFFPVWDTARSAPRRRTRPRPRPARRPARRRRRHVPLRLPARLALVPVPVPAPQPHRRVRALGAHRRRPNRPKSRPLRQRASPTQVRQPLLRQPTPETAPAPPNQVPRPFHRAPLQQAQEARRPRTRPHVGLGIQGPLLHPNTRKSHPGSQSSH